MTRHSQHQPPFFIECPPDRHVPVEFDTLALAVAAKLPQPMMQREFRRLTRLMQALSLIDNMDVNQAVKRDFRPFLYAGRVAADADAAGSSSSSSSGGSAAAAATKALDESELRVLDKFLELMSAARFQLMTRGEWALATCDSFLFEVPLHVDMSLLDDKLLRRFWAASSDRAALRASLPHFADRLLLLHRGAATATQSGYYISEKLDLLTSYLVLQPAASLWRALRALPAMLLPGRSGAAARGGAEGEGATSTAAASARQQGRQPHRHAKRVERRTLRSQLPTAWSVVRGLLTKHHLQEPCYKDVVILYRSVNGPADADASASLGGAAPPASAAAPAPPHADATAQAQSLSAELRRRNLNIKWFGDIPLADMEVVFPWKHARVNPVLLVQLVATMAVALLGFLYSLARPQSRESGSGGGVSFAVVASGVGAVLARASTVYYSMQAQKDAVMNAISSMLYHKSGQAQEGVLAVLLEAMAEQRLKECALAYGLLLANGGGRPMTAEALDAAAEDFVLRTFGLAMDVELSGCLPALQAWGVVRHVVSISRGSSGGGGLGGTSWEAVPLSEAVPLLQRQCNSACVVASDTSPTFNRSGSTAAAAAAARRSSSDDVVVVHAAPVAAATAEPSGPYVAMAAAVAASEAAPTAAKAAAPTASSAGAQSAALPPLAASAPAASPSVGSKLQGLFRRKPATSASATSK